MREVPTHNPDVLSEPEQPSDQEDNRERASIEELLEAIESPEIINFVDGVVFNVTKGYSKDPDKHAILREELRQEVLLKAIEQIKEGKFKKPIEKLKP